MILVDVALPDGRSYPVHVGAGARRLLADLVDAAVPGARRVAVVSQTGVPAAGTVAGPETRTFLIPSGEDAKSLSTVESLCRQWAAWGLNRGDCVVAVGGGMVTDVGGFAASVYHRGVPVFYVSTTLLGMVDAAIGGKTGVNLAEGKNLVGSFWQPSGVLCDTDDLATLAPREYRSGLGEMAKYHFIGAPELDELPMEERIARCVRLKADVVASDEREGGRRAILNYGHTLAHALEIAGRFDLLHGEAVAIGLIYAAELAHRLGRIDAARVKEHRRVVAGYDLPTRLPPGTDAASLIQLMGRDKKAITGTTFVLDGPNGVEPVVGVDPEVIMAALEGVR